MRHGKASAIAPITRWFATRVAMVAPSSAKLRFSPASASERAGWQIARHGGVEGAPAALAERGTARLPGRSCVPSPLADGAPSLKDRVRHREGRMGPAQPLTGARNLVRTQGGTVARGGSCLRRRAEADHRAAFDHRGPRLGLGCSDGRRDGLRIVAVNALRMPAGGFETRASVVGEGEAGGAIDRDIVGIVEHDQAVQPQMAGKRDRLLADALHQATVAADDIGVVVHKFAAEPGSHAALRQRHADRVGEALAERAGGGLDPGGDAVLRMASGAAAELAEIADLVDIDIRIAGQIKQRIEQHRAVPVREHEAVPVGPVGARGVELEEAAEENGRDIGKAHGHAGMAGTRLLHRVHRESADRVRHIRVTGARCAPFSR